MEYFPTANQFYLAIFLSIVNALVLCFCCYKFLQVLQLGNYRVSSLFIWLKDTRSKYLFRLFILAFLGVSGVLVTNVLFDAFLHEPYFSYFGLIFYLYFAIVFILNVHRTPNKVRLKYTSRINRFMVVLFLFCAGMTFMLTAFCTKFIPSLRFGAVTLMPVLLVPLILFIYYIMLPFEELNKLRYLLKAKNKLKKHEGLIRIGITGSYGKTSCKEILTAMLKCKYQVCASPANFNNEMGFSKTVNNFLNKEHEILIFEMGARNIWDIKYLSKLFNPQHGILTSVGPQHLATFKTVENVAKGKYALIESLPKDGIAVFNGNNKICKDLYNKTELKNKILSKMPADVKVDKHGSSFKWNGVSCSTKLLGGHSIENIVVCAEMALKLGVSKEQIAEVIGKLKAPKHRLELLESPNGFTILDDSYNCNVQGTMAALEVLKLFDGTKVVMTPGIVELGVREYEENFRFGVRIAKVADKVIIVNKAHKDALEKGLLSCNFKQENIFFADTLFEARALFPTVLTTGCVLLIENDLPDNYI